MKFPVVFLGLSILLVLLLFGRFSNYFLVNNDNNFILETLRLILSFKNVSVKNMNFGGNKMGICRILGLIGSASCLGMLVFLSVEEGIPDRPVRWWISISLAFLVFNFFPVRSNKFSDSLIGLWIDAKKAKLRKEIDVEHIQ